MTLSILRGLQRIHKEIKAATKAGDTAAALAAQERLNEAIKAGVNSPLMPRAAPLTDAQIRAYAERMAPQIAGELTRKEKGAKTVAGKSQKQFKREQTLPVQREVVEGAVDPMAPLTPLSLEEQRGGVLLGLPGDPSLARVKLSGIGDVEFERPITLHGGPRYGDEDKLWASNLSAASGLLGAAGRASKQYGEAPVIASYIKMPSGLPFAQHYLESLLQYQRPDLLGKQARAALEKDIKSGYVNAQKKRVTFPDFPGFGDMDAVMDAALQDSNLRKHIASRLEKSEKYGLRPAEDVQFAVSHPELTNLETGASGFTLGELPLGQALTESAHPTYSHDIAGKVIGQLRHPTPYDLLYRDQLELIRQNPNAPEFNTLKLLGARQQIDEQLINEINEYQERVRRLIGKKKGGAVEMAGGGKTRAGGPAKPFPWEEAIAEQYERTKSRLKGLATEPEAELQRILEQYLPKKGDSPEERKRKLEELAMGFAGTTIGKVPPMIKPQALEAGKQKFLEPSKIKQRLYHGTTSDIYEFDPAAAAQQTGNPTSYFGTFLSESPKEAERYARNWQRGGTYGGNIMPLHVQMTNPYPMSYKEYSQYAEGEFNRFLKNPSKEMQDKHRQEAMQDVLARKQQLIDQGYDGIVVKVGGINEYIPFSPNQIKSATGNVGTYDITNPDITKAKGGLALRETQEGLAPHGIRHSGEGVKGSGYFGYLPSSEGYATEISAEDESGEYPLLVPTLSREEIEHLLAGNAPTEDIYRKAVEHADRRRKAGKSPFAEATGLKYPVEKADGGAVSFELPEDVTPQNWRKHLASNVLADAKALLGVKDGGAINVDELLEQAMEKHEPINVDNLLDWAIAKQNHKMKKGGAVSQTFPLKKDEEDETTEGVGKMFSPAPLKIPEPITDAVEALKRQFEKEKRSMSKPGAVQDVLLRGPAALAMGVPADIVGMSGELLDYAQKKIPALRKPASVMDTGPEKVPPMGYAPAFPLSPEEPYGTVAAQELMGKAGLTTGTERPLLELTTGVASPFVTSAALKTGKALAPTAKEMTQFALERSMAPYQMNIIKPEGGNWVKGAAEKFLKDLRYDESLIDPVGVMNPADKAEETARVAAMNNFVDKKLSRYLTNQMGTPSDPLRLQADAWAETQKTLLADKEKQISKVRSDIQRAQQARGVDPEVLTRSQARLRELQKERDLIKNRKGLHFEPGGVMPAISRRQEAGFPTPYAKTEMGGKWEDVSDIFVISAPYMNQPEIGLAKTYAEIKNAAAGDKIADKATLDIVNRELEKMGGKYALENPEASAYRLRGGHDGAQHLGFDHMMDEIDNALRPNQGLPDYLQLKPKDLDKMSVAQVADHVDKINAWRASQKAEVDAARAANAATVEHKAYDVVPGTNVPNEQGLRWVEIKVPDFNALPIEERKALISKLTDEAKQKGMNPENYIENYPQSILEDALKYEGEILQHCVGGYCPDVIEGRSRIFSLRDAEGRPHATIEVEPNPRIGFRQGEGPQGDEFYVQQNKYIAGQNDGSIPNDVTFAEWWRSQNGIEEPARRERISQIKGLQNRKPKDEYMPFIQDFVKSGNWSHVKDLHHTDLIKVAPDSELATKMKTAGVKPPQYVSQDDLTQLLKEYQDLEKGMKRGGRVTKADLEREFKYQYGGLVYNTDPDLTESGRIIPEHTI